MVHPTPPTRYSNAAAGIAWMMLSCALLAGVAGLGRYVALEDIPTMQTVFLRLLFALISFLPLLAWRGVEMVRTQHLRLYLIRVVIGLTGMSLWFAALAEIPVGEVTAIGFLAPIFGTIGAALLLGEVVRWRRWTATLVAFLGAMLIVRPGFAEVSYGNWLALGAALGMAAAGLMIKNLSGKDDPDKLVFIALCFQTPLAGIFAVFVWVPVPTDLWAIYALMGLIGMLGHITLARAFRAADASLVMSLEFARLPFAVAFGYALFGELIDLWTWIGAAVIFAAATYTAQRERQIQRGKAVPPTAEIAAKSPT
ncbi:MAG: DMT family transporter [Pseudomonadota bacterium]